VGKNVAVGNFTGDSNCVVDNGHPPMGLRCRIPHRNFREFKAQNNTFHLNPKWAR